MAEAVLEFDEVSRVFLGPPKVTALQDCSASVFDGDFVTVRGPSGSGKSTWLHLAGLLDRPTTGTLRLGGVDTSALSEKRRTGLRALWIGFVFQSFHLMPQRTVLENVEIQGVYQGLKPRDRNSRSSGIVERVGLAHRRDAPTNQLSGGEMQRVAIGRALMGEPRLLLCDEPTGNLDSANGQQIMELLAELNDDGVTVVIITHDPLVAAAGSRQFLIQDGRLSEHV